MKRIIVVSSDPGVTRALVPVARELVVRQCEVYIVASGPAVHIWRETVPNIGCAEFDDNVSENEAAMFIATKEPYAVVVGAGAYNKIEHTFRRAATSCGVFCFALLDYWSCYHLRFRRENADGITYSYPDLVGVMDELSFDDMVNCGFDASRLLIVGAPHLEESIKCISMATEKNKKMWRTNYGFKKDIVTFVFFSQTMTQIDSNIADEDYGQDDLPPWGFTQGSILREIIQAVSHACEKLGKKAQLIVKTHPLENKSVLSRAVETGAKSPLLDCRIIEDGEAWKLISLADVVLSMTSTALLEAALAGKPSFSVLIGINDTTYQDNYYGNFSGITKPIYEAESLQYAMVKMLNEVRQCESFPASSKFLGSTIKVVETILGQGVAS
jgi:hypothetical protein